jgi:hypothetical protein
MKFILLAIILSTTAFCLDTIPDERDWLKKEYLPFLEGRVLFVGVNYYTEDYVQYAKQPELFETIDLLPERAQFGSPYKHYTGEFITFDPGYQYDHICLFGVMGHYGDLKSGEPFTIDTEENITQALEQAHKLLKMGGTLQLGPNRVCVPEQNTAFWQDRLKQYPLNKYNIVTDVLGPCNVVWWGRKTTE